MRNANADLEDKAEMPTRYDAAVQMLRVFEVDEVPSTNEPKISLRLE
jgi:hypothetical protein